MDKIKSSDKMHEFDEEDFRKLNNLAAQRQMEAYLLDTDCMLSEEGKRYNRITIR